MKIEKHYTKNGKVFIADCDFKEMARQFICENYDKIIETIKRENLIKLQEQIRKEQN